MPADAAALAAVPRLMENDANLPALLTVMDGHLRKYPGDSRALVLKADLLHRNATVLADQGRGDAALQMLDELLTIDPADIKARRLRSKLLRESGREQDAVEEEARIRGFEKP
ncbi:MAG: hypothetical protein ABIF71_15915 [Planctomycetota bacterium]